MKCIGMVWHGNQNLLIQRFGFCKATSLMLPNRLLKQSLDLVRAESLHSWTLARREGEEQDQLYSHSIVPGGLLVTS